MAVKENGLYPFSELLLSIFISQVKHKIQEDEQKMVDNPETIESLRDENARLCLQCNSDYDHQQFHSRQWEQLKFISVAKEVENGSTDEISQQGLHGDEDVTLVHAVHAVDEVVSFLPEKVADEQVECETEHQQPPQKDDSECQGRLVDKDERKCHGEVPEAYISKVGHTALEGGLEEGCFEEVEFANKLANFESHYLQKEKVAKQARNNVDGQSVSKERKHGLQQHGRRVLNLQKSLTGKSAIVRNPHSLLRTQQPKNSIKDNKLHTFDHESHIKNQFQYSFMPNLIIIVEPQIFDKKVSVLDHNGMIYRQGKYSRYREMNWRIIERLLEGLKRSCIDHGWRNFNTSKHNLINT